MDIGRSVPRDGQGRCLDLEVPAAMRTLLIYEGIRMTVDGLELFDPARNEH